MTGSFVGPRDGATVVGEPLGDGLGFAFEGEKDGIDVDGERLGPEDGATDPTHRLHVKGHLS